jgi:hypothetical protein
VPQARPACKVEPKCSQSHIFLLEAGNSEADTLYSILRVLNTEHRTPHFMPQDPQPQPIETTHDNGERNRTPTTSSSRSLSCFSNVHGSIYAQK